MAAAAQAVHQVAGSHGTLDEEGKAALATVRAEPWHHEQLVMLRLDPSDDEIWTEILGVESEPDAHEGWWERG